jgi:outer membrane lipoprotein-sorting protein
MWDWQDSRKSASVVKLLVTVMNARLLAITLLITVFATAQTSTAPAPSPASNSQDANARKARQILDQMIQALGGQAYMSIQDMSQEGRGYSFYQGKPDSLGTVFWLFWKFPDKQRVELTKQRDIITINNGDDGYDVTYRGTALEDKEQLQTYNRYRKHSLENVLRVWLTKPNVALFYDGTAVAEQKATDSVTVMDGDDSVTIFVDRYTHLPVKKTFTWRDPNDRLRNEEAEIYDAFRPEQGVMTPHVTMRSRNGETTSQRFITSVKYNAGLADSMFDAKVSWDPYKTPQRKK